MTIPYKILWVDDSPAWVESIRSDVELHISSMGLTPSIVVLVDGTDLEKASRETDLDLLIIDYHLPNQNGDKLIEVVRASGAFTEIVFYSQSNDIYNIAKPFDNVFSCHRDDALDRIRTVVDLSLRKLKDVGIVRGLIIASAIDIETQVEQLFAKILGTAGHVVRDRIIEKGWLDAEKKSSFVLGVLNDYIKHLKGLGSVVEQSLLDGQATLKKFSDEVIKTRNLLAHSRAFEVGGKKVLYQLNDRSKSQEITLEWLSQTREKYEQHRKNLDLLSTLMMSESILPIYANSPI
jgi:CheY-like chemotaxis protein